MSAKSCSVCVCVFFFVGVVVFHFLLLFISFFVPSYIILIILVLSFCMHYLNFLFLQGKSNFLLENKVP